MAKSTEVPKPETIQKYLRHLVTRGLVLWSVRDDCRELLGFQCVRAKVEGGSGEPSPEQLFEALAAYLEEAISRVDKRQYQILLTIVLAVEPRYRETTAKERRTVAGREFRGGSKPVTWGNIRQHHEPKALTALSVIFHADELAARNLGAPQPVA